jgi:thiamine-phosphate pyrophosphorylase
VNRRARLNECRLYFICGERPGGRPLQAVLPAALAGGVDIFQLRMKQADDSAIVQTAAIARAACAETGALFILNDRPDLVAATGADGVHVGQDDAAIGAARAALGEELLIGVSTHAPAQLDAAIANGADYAGAGPVYETPTKPGRAAVGLDYVRYAAAQSSIPFFAIGGLDGDDAAAAVSAGATRLAVVRAIAQAADPEAAASALRAVVETKAFSGAS